MLTEFLDLLCHIYWAHMLDYYLAHQFLLFTMHSLEYSLSEFSFDKHLYIVLIYVKLLFKSTLAAIQFGYMTNVYYMPS